MTKAKQQMLAEFEKMRVQMSKMEEAAAIFQTEEQQLAACMENLAELDELIGPDNETEY